ncbi:WD40 repeat domain-containing protein [Streptomyces tauricus]|uniref:WD40 repeat domain-containing protein n=1 Tax=Streptomyces tauricus TaxID=68274 RepID=UPI0022434229|nr:WD40 repeat domain-containing protein [Streptomyces tauricus]MCW8094992.1 WD40 repeat domain-containing protein [Streptomyces tauricus]
MRRSFVLLAGALLAGVLAVPAVAADHEGAEGSDGSDGSDGFTLQDPRITESSGLAASRAHPGVYWTHNDSDDGAFLYAVDGKTGKTVATVTMTGVGRPRDVEAISVGPNGHLYVGDIGDNLGGTWDHVWIYELPEPKELKDQTVRATQYDVKYADGARDAEALMVHPKTGRVYIVSKNEDGGGLYEGPAELSASGTNTFRRTADIGLWVTDGAFSPDGRQLAVRGYFGGIAYKWNNGKPKRQAQLNVPLQRQGESMTYTPDGSTLLFGSEGSGSSVEAGSVPGAGGDKSSSGKGGSADGGDGDDGANGNFKMGAIALAVAFAVVYGLKRLFRRGD